MSYKATEVKFTLNGDFELKEKDNRRIEFGPVDTAVYWARFDEVGAYNRCTSWWEVSVGNS